MYKKDKVSIIIPLYNNKIYIEKCISSILNQNYKNYEIIIIDDGSTDNGYEFIKQNFLNKNIKLLRQENKGPSAARNKGIDISDGEWIMFLDSDDYLKANALEKLINESENSDLIIAGWIGIYNKISVYYGPDLNCVLDAKELEDLVSSLISNGTLYKNRHSYIPSIEGPVAKLYSSKIIKKNNILFQENIRYGEDVIFNFEYLQYCKSVKTINEGVYCAIRHTDSLSNTNKNLIEIYDIFEKDIKKINIEKWNLKEMLLHRKFVWYMTHLEENINKLKYSHFCNIFNNNKFNELIIINTKRLSIYKKIQYYSMKKNRFCFFIILKYGVLMKNIKKRFKYE